MLFIFISLYCCLLGLSFGEEISLFAKDLSKGNDDTLLAIINYDPSNHNVTVQEIENSVIKSNNPHCIVPIFRESADYEHLNNNCFNFINIDIPLHYNLIIEVHKDDNKIHKLSIVENKQVDGLQPIISYPTLAHEAPATKLKKVTKTYKDKKLEKQNPSQSEGNDNNEDAKELMWIQKNWKIVVLGWVIYNVIVNGVKKAQEKSKEEMNKRD